MRLPFLVAATLWASTASADPTISIFAEHATAMGEAERLGTGFGARVGYGFDAIVADLRPEIGFTRFAPNGVWLPSVGAQLRFGKLVEPGVYGHLIVPLGNPDHTRRGYDAGATLDFTAVPNLDLGVHAGVVSVWTDPLEDAGTSLSVGLHLTATL